MTPNYKSQRIGVVVFTSAFIIIGTAAVLYGIIAFISFWMKHDELQQLGVGGASSMGALLPIAVGGIFIFSGMSIMRNKLRQLRLFETKTYSEYIKLNPQQIRNGRVACNRCQSSDVRTKALMNKTYHREHYCGLCGATLYYSPEGV